MAPELTLLFSSGDTAALPALVAASACGVTLKHAPLDKSSNALLTSAAPFADATSVLLTGPEGLVLYEPIAIARYIASLTTGPFLPAYGAPHHLAVEKWLEWTETTLHPAVVSAVSSGKPSELPSDLMDQLEQGAKGSEGKELTLADVAVFWRLIPVLGGADARPSKVAEWFGTLVASKHVASAIKSILGDQNPQTLADQSRKAISASVTAASAKPKPSKSQTPAEKPAASKPSKPAPANASDSKIAAKAGSKGPVKAEAAVKPVVITDPGSPYLEVTGPPRAPVKGKRNVLVTSALPYVNNVPHLGNIIGSVLSADVYARYCRRRGYNVIYMCGTDEYGTATENKALEEGLTPREICDKYHVIHRDIYKWFDISFDHFGRTSTPQQTDIAQAIFRSLLDQNRLIEDSMEQLYCDLDQKFLADRFVEGTCPNCQYEDARGDQCDKCGKLLNPTDLISPRCKICGTTPRIRSTEHLFLDLPTLKPQLEDYINATSGVGEWSANSIATTGSWIRDGLKPRCITRDLKWGVPVPLEKFKDKVFYVWFDAPIGYISITANYTDSWKEWWHSPKDVELVQFMGKDNVPFHTVIFPSTLLGTAEPWTLMKTISVTEYLNYEDGKFSKSRGVGVFGNDAQSTGVPSEVWRYYLLVNRPEVSDTVFMWSDLQAKTNGELLANLGNFVNRALKFLADRLDATIPEAKAAASNAAVVALGKEVQDNVREYVSKLEKAKLKDGLKIAMNISALGNKFFQDNKPWVLLKEDKPACEDIVATAVGLVRLLATLLEPYMPAFAHKVLKQLNLPPSSLSLTDADVELTSELWKLVPAGHKIGAPEPLFREMSNEEVAANKLKFAGSQADRKAAESAATASAASGASSASTSSSGPATPAANNGKPKKEKDKGAKEPKGGSSRGAKEAEKPVDVSRLDIRVGKIVSVKKHPDADSLYVEEIDVGEAEPRTVVSGLVKYIPLEGMQNQVILTVCNLKPVAMRGVKSHAMVLCASDAEKTKIEFVRPPEGAKVGERITFPAYPGEPDEQLNPKKKVWETVQPGFVTTESLVATWKGDPFTTSAGVCTVASIPGGSIS